MKQSKYSSLKNQPPILSVKDGAREVIITTISCMCDNRHYLTLKKNNDGDFKLYGNRRCIGNWQMSYPAHEIEWTADEGKWSTVFDMINSGTSAISEVKSR